MAPVPPRDRVVRVRREEHDGIDPDLEEEEVTDGDDVDAEEDSTSAQSEDENDSSHDEALNGATLTSAESSPEPTALQEISFGALAAAQAALLPNPRKRKLQEEPDTAEAKQKVSYTNSHKDESSYPRRKVSRPSKHAPATLSTRYAVPRARQILSPPPSLKSRDPRFDPTVTASSASHNPQATSIANKNYAFLTTYQVNEILALKAQIKKSTDPTVTDDLKRQVMRIESKLRASETKQREHAILKAHKEKEKSAIREGRKSQPYYLKPSEVKKAALKEKFEAMSKKAQDKALERQRKRQKGKDAKGMPRFRREREARPAG